MRAKWDEPGGEWTGWGWRTKKKEADSAGKTQESVILYLSLAHPSQTLDKPEISNSNWYSGHIPDLPHHSDEFAFRSNSAVRRLRRAKMEWRWLEVDLRRAIFFDGASAANRAVWYTPDAGVVYNVGLYSPRTRFLPLELVAQLIL